MCNPTLAIVGVHLVSADEPSCDESIVCILVDLLDKLQRNQTAGRIPNTESS